MIHLRSMEMNRVGISASTKNTFPFNVPVMKSFSAIEFTSDVTFLVGENGSGKSTFLETIAASASLNTIGSESVETDKTLTKIRAFAKHFKLTWNKKTRLGFYMRSEDFFGYAKRMTNIREDLTNDLDDIEEEYKDRSTTAKNYARMPYMREIGDMQRDYGEALDSRSHGESYFTLFKSRFVPNGLYLLDEPEAPLSPMRQLIFLSMLRLQIKQNAQFIIATHSPIILGYPEAKIYSFDGSEIEQVKYENLDHVIMTRAFLNNPKSYTDRLFSDLEE